MIIGGIILLALFVNWGSFLWVSLTRALLLEVYIRAPDCCKLSFTKALFGI